MRKSASLLHQLVSCVALTAGLLLVHPAAAQRAIPDAAPLNNWNPLCESSTVPCLDIDPFAGHASGHLQVLPKTDLRDTAARFPFGLVLGLGGRVVGGISTDFSFWKEGDILYQQLGPLRLHLTGRLLPLFPLITLGSEPGHDGDQAPRATPSRGFQLGLAYDQELRVGPFSGANSLGFLGDLASLQIVGSKRLGPFQLSASIGALYDWHGAFATGTAAGQLGLFIPGFSALKVFVQGMGRGFPVYTKPDVALPLLPDGQSALHPQTMVGGGLAFMPHQRVDLGVEVQRGFGGGIAPWVVGINFLVLSAGKRYEGRAATPIPQLAADATVEAAKALAAYLASLPVDPSFDSQCILLDDNGDPMVNEPMGTRTPDGKACMVQGEKFPIGESFWRDKKKSVVCRDDKLTDCLLYRRRDAHGYRVLHRPWVGEDCVLRENVYDTDSPAAGQLPRAVQLAVLGTQTPDKKGCRDSSGHVHAVGKQYYREDGHLWVCDAPKIEEQRERCFMALPEQPQKMQNQVTKTGRIARALDQGMSRKAEAINQMPGEVAKSAEDVADGKITVSTVKNALLEKARYIAAHANKAEAEKYLREKATDAKAWWNTPAIEKGEGVARGVGGAMIPDPVTVATVVIPGGGAAQGVLRVGEELEEAAKLGKQIHNAGKLVTEGAEAAKQAKHAAGAVKAEKRAVQAVQAASEATAQLAGVGTVEDGKLGYLLGQASGRAHNVERTLENAGQLARVGLYDTPETRALLKTHLQSVAADPSNAMQTFTNQYGKYVIKDSLLAGPSGFVKFESTWQIMDDGGLRLTTVIPFGGRTK